jgi:hypothetical protein
MLGREANLIPKALPAKCKLAWTAEGQLRCALIVPWLNLRWISSQIAPPKRVLIGSMAKPLNVHHQVAAGRNARASTEPLHSILIETGLVQAAIGSIGHCAHVTNEITICKNFTF